MAKKMLKNGTLVFIFLCLGLETREQEVDIRSTSPTDICTICSCIDSIVDCRDRGLTKTNYSWPNRNNLKIYLDFNFFPNLTKILATNVTLLSLANNRIKSVDNKVFENLNSLVDLDLSCNYLIELNPEIFYGQYDVEYYHPLKLLRSLNLSHNGIRSLHHDLFVHLPNLEILDLSHNPIRIIEDNTRMVLSKISFLKILDLSYTGIADLPEYFLHNSYFLNILNLEGNIFTQIPQKFLDDGHDFVYVNLNKNPLKVFNVTDSKHKILN